MAYITTQMILTSACAPAHLSNDLQLNCLDISGNHRYTHTHTYTHRPYIYIYNILHVLYTRIYTEVCTHVHPSCEQGPATSRRRDLTTPRIDSCARLSPLSEICDFRFLLSSKIPSPHSYRNRILTHVYKYLNAFIIHIYTRCLGVFSVSFAHCTSTPNTHARVSHFDVREKS